MVEHAIAQWTGRRRLRAAVVPAAIGPYTRVMTTSTVVYERAAWEHGDYWWSTTPCCSREIRLHYAYARYKARLERAMETPGIDPDPEDRYQWFWRAKQCRTCGARWDVLFDYAESCYLGPRSRQEIIEAEPLMAWWRPA